jgi:hypothetical protein
MLCHGFHRPGYVAKHGIKNGWEQTAGIRIQKSGVRSRNRFWLLLESPVAFPRDLYLFLQGSSILPQLFKLPLSPLHGLDPAQYLKPAEISGNPKKYGLPVSPE